ncbi:MAG: xanthine dehydrogenase family protein [FCB group bacterium]|nr:xanthine dehydrogenase family protein [FCB group bacterium]
MSTKPPKFSTIGHSLTRPDAQGKITGTTEYIPDITIPRMVHAAPVTSPVPFGRLETVDPTPARSIPGFIEFIGAEHIPWKNQVGVIIQDQPLMADSVVRYVGDSIGLVIAESPTAAREAAQAIRIHIDPLPAVFTIDEARDASGPFIHDTNLACTHQVVNGDAATELDQADRIIEARLSTPFQEHFYLEPQGCIAIPEPDGSFTLIGSIQCPFYVQKAVAGALGIPFNQVCVKQAPIGGAFGGKEDIPSELCARAAVAAYHLRRPVRLVYTREEDIQLTSKRHPFQMHYQVGVMNDGILVAAKVLLEENAGAYATLSTVVSYRSSIQALGPYRVPHVDVVSNSYYTNNPPTGAFRGFGSPQAAFGHERMMDMIARELGLDPLELRLKNLLRIGDTTVTGQKLMVSVGAEETLQRAANAAEWPRKVKSASGSRYRTGLGIGTIHYGNCLGAAGWALDGAGVKLSLARDGSVAVAFGLVEMGQGALTVVQQMTAEALGIDPERITVLPTDSRQVPDSGPSVASRNVVMTGNAIRKAAEALLPVLKRTAAETLDSSPESIKISGDKAIDTSSGDFLTFDALAEALYLNNQPMESLGWWHVPRLNFKPETGQGEAYFTYSFATQIAQVTVDTLTGQIAVDHVWAAHDVGQAVNPAGIEGQVEGGVAQGVGLALTEHFLLDKGQVISDNFTTYLVPTALDSPEVTTQIVEAPEPEGPWGAKGIGEPAIIPTAAAIANAVSNALGVQVHEIPITPEKVLEILKHP